VLLDTGSTDSVMSLDAARRVFNVNVNAPDVQKGSRIAGGSTANIYRRRFKKLELDGVVISDPLITLLPNAMGPPPAPPTGSFFWENDDLQDLPELTLGMSVLSKLHVYIAYKERKLYLSTGAPSPAP